MCCILILALGPTSGSHLNSLDLSKPLNILNLMCNLLGSGGCVAACEQIFFLSDKPTVK